MKQLNTPSYTCDGCSSSITNQEHILLDLTYESAVMLPPYKAEAHKLRLVPRQGRFHLCSPDCGSILLQKLMRGAVAHKAVTEILPPVTSYIVRTDVLPSMPALAPAPTKKQRTGILKVFSLVLHP